MWQTLTCVVVTIALAVGMLAGCADPGVPTDSTILAGEATERIAYSPIDVYVDISDRFSPSSQDPFSDNAPKSSITCSKEGAETYCQSDAPVTIPSDTKVLRIHGTWKPQGRMVYIGLRNTETDAFYVLPATGGSVSGRITLEKIPAGEYDVILCSEDNPSVVAVLWYQLA